MISSHRFCMALVSLSLALQACLPGEKITSPPESDSTEKTGKIYSQIFKPGEEGYAFFRIPASIVTEDGTILVFAEGRVDNAEDYGNIDIVLKRSEDGGKSWGNLIVVADDWNNRCGNPSPVALESGKILLLYSWSKTGYENSVDDVVYTIFSDDNGKTWGKKTDITGQIRSEGESNFHTGPVHGIVKAAAPSAGRILIPVWGSNPKAFVIYSDDNGITWEKGGSMDYPSANESTVAELCDGRIIINTRNGNKSDYYRYDAVSEDGGKTFLPSRKTTLVEPVNGCQGSIIQYGKNETDGKTILLFSNPNHTSSRRFGTIKASFDNGDTWSKMYQFVPSTGDGIYTSYSDMVVIDGTIGVIYEAGFKNSGGIVFQTVEFKDIKEPIQ